jgi:TonB family protein
MSFLALLAIKVLLLFGAAWLVSALWRKSSAALRHQVWAAAILCSLALPLIQPVTPQWHVAGLAARTMANLDVGTVPPPVVVRVTASRAHRWIPAHIVLWIWCAGAIAMLVRLLVALAQLSRAGSRARPVFGDASFRRAAEIAASLGTPPSVRLLASHSRLAMPLTWGLFRPKILLPSNAMEWPEDRLRLVLSHELAHVARHDWILRICSELACALYWFHPLAWLAARSLREESERACDDVVLGSGIVAADYADQLLALARTLDEPARRWSAALAMARPSNFERRLIAMLNPSMNRRRASSRARLLTAIVSLCVLLPLAALRAPGQGTAGNFSGTVSDPSGAVVPGATVTAANTADPSIKTNALTDAVGKFQFANLPAGQYTLIVMVPGFRPNLTPVILSAGQDTAKSVVLDLAQAQFVARVSAPGTPRATQPAAPVPIRVGGMVQMLRLISKVTPEYPTVAQAAGIEGTVDLEAVIGKDGSVLDLRALGPFTDRDLVKAAMNAVRQWRYTPTLLNGEPVEVVTQVSVQFTLTQ